MTDAVAVLLREPHDGLEHAAEVLAGGDPLEQPALARGERFGALALCDVGAKLGLDLPLPAHVGQGADDAHRLARRPVTT